MEKAHPDVFNILLQLLDDGRLTDAKGNTVNFKNCVVIFTSNIGSHQILEQLTNNSNIEEIQTKVMEELKSRFRPEFLNRIDDFVTFNPLSKGQLSDIVLLELNKVKSRLQERKLGFEITPAAINWLAAKGYDVLFGVRPLKRTIQKEVETPIAQVILTGNYGIGDTMKVDVPSVQALLQKPEVSKHHLSISVVKQTGVPAISKTETTENK